MKAYHIYRDILCLDLKSFYASVECADRGLDPFKTPLVVADKERGGGSIVLAVTPFLKQRGVPSRLRVHELPPDKDIIFARPRMGLYLEYATKIIDIYLRYVAEEDLHIYSVDEVFLDLTPYHRCHGSDIPKIAVKIMEEVKNETKIPLACGIGQNMLLAKLALDLEAKKAQDYIAIWRYDDVEEKLWPITPLSEMWGIGKRRELSLNGMGIHSVGDLANADVKRLKKRFGIIGEELYYHAHGIDQSLIQDKPKHIRKGKSMGIGQTLFRDYYPPDIFLLIQEMVDDLCSRLRLAKKKARTISLGIGYGKHIGGGFHRQTTLDHAVASEQAINEACRALFLTYYEGYPIRRIHIGVTKLDDGHIQFFNLFDDDTIRRQEEKVFHALDEIKARYGRNSVHRATALTEASTMRKRNAEIGGHHA